MPLPLVQISSTIASPLYFTTNNPFTAIHLLPKSFLPGFGPTSSFLKHFLNFKACNNNNNNNKSNLWVNNNKKSHRNGMIINATLLENPVLWAGRLCVFYALLKAGLAGSHSNPLLSDLGAAGISDETDLGFSKWLDKFQKNPDKEAADKRKLVSKWHPTTKGTLRRNYRIQSRPEGRRLLKAIASLLSEDDHFVDASSHKGCQIRRESAHGESVCCNNVRALFDELPTPHLIVEITPFPARPLTEKDYAKAEKLEKVLRSSPSV